jgi:plastocyanin
MITIPITIPVDRVSIRSAWLVLCAVLAFAAAAQAADETPTVQLAITQHRFSPGEVRVPAGVRVKLLVRNDDALPAEFESYDLSREVVVPGHSQVTVYIGPLAAGRYNFFNDFDRSAQGWVVVGQPAK